MDHFFFLLLTTLAYFLQIGAEVTVEKLGLTFEHAGAVSGKHCNYVKEPAESDPWENNFVCFNKDYGARWSHAGPIDGMECTQINEPDDPETWDNNYLCVPNDNVWRFLWSYAGKLEGKSCVQMNEPADRAKWENNYLCVDEFRVY